MPTRRQFLRTTALGGAAMYFNVFGAWGSAFAVPLAAGLSDPALQPKFANPVPNALNPGFIYRNNGGNQKYAIDIRPGVTMTGLLGTNGQPVPTPIFGYGEKGQATWPGKTFEVVRGTGPVEVKWRNKLLDAGGAPVPHLLPVDTSLHWAYSLPGYEQYTIAANGVPTVVHLHGGHTDAPFDGNPEFFFGPGYNTRGPRWMDKSYEYRNDQPAGTLWYHDHALGITRLNVYAGMAGFYIVRDGDDTGRPDNPLGLPAFPYEAAYAIQDRMFHADGRLFYPAFPGDPFYDDFITGEGAILPPELFPGGGPTALAEFFGDHMLVNGVIWPLQNVEPRNYRIRLLNGTDSRFMALRFRVASSPTATDLQGAGAPIPFWVIGADQGLAKSATELDTLLFEPGGRYDVVFDFSSVPAGSRVIVENILGDAPYGGELPEPGDLFPNRQTDRVMAFDVVLPENTSIPDLFDPTAIAGYQGNGATPTRTRKVALFEGLDEFGRLQPLLGTAEPTLAADGSTLEGAIGWHRPTTENPGVGDTEIWEIYNATGDAHPIHLHLVHFEVVNRQDYFADLVSQPVLQHNGTVGTGFRLENITLAGSAEAANPEERAPRDMVTAFPGQVTRVKPTFDLPGRYVWHCHILSHEDHEMMRALHVGPGA